MALRPKLLTNVFDGFSNVAESNVRLHGLPGGEAFFVYAYDIGEARLYELFAVVDLSGD